MRTLGLNIVIVLSILIMAIPVIADDSPSFELKGYGYVKLDASYDQNATSHGNFAMWVKPQSLDQNDAQFNMTHKSTRLGLNIIGKGYQQFKINGKFEVDMYGSGGTENKAMLLLRHAYFTIEKGNFKLLAGQSWDLISPLNPSTLNYPVLWGAGNIQYRRPQVTAHFTTHKSATSNSTFSVGMFRTIGSDLTPTFSLALGETADGVDDGADAAIPSIQSRFDYNHKSASGTKIRAGVSTLWGQLKSETTLGNSTKYESNVIAGHLMLSFSNGAGLSGEYFSGSNLGSYFGGVLNSNSIDGVGSKGGWVSAWIKASPRVKLTTGYSVDDPNDDDLSAGNKSKNSAIFGNIKYSLVPKVTIGMEVTQWETEYITGETAKALRFETSFIMSI